MRAGPEHGRAALEARYVGCGRGEMVAGRGIGTGTCMGAAQPGVRGPQRANKVGAPAFLAPCTSMLSSTFRTRLRLEPI